MNANITSTHRTEIVFCFVACLSLSQLGRQADWRGCRRQTEETGSELRCRGTGQDGKCMCVCERESV
eukprot:2965792-Rhodomonas_salina.3